MASISAIVGGIILAFLPREKSLGSGLGLKFKAMRCCWAAHLLKDNGSGFVLLMNLADCRFSSRKDIAFLF